MQRRKEKRKGGGRKDATMGRREGRKEGRKKERISRKGGRKDTKEGWRTER